MGVRLLAHTRPILGTVRCPCDEFVRVTQNTFHLGRFSLSSIIVNLVHKCSIHCGALLSAYSRNAALFLDFFFLCFLFVFFFLSFCLSLALSLYLLEGLNSHPLRLLQHLIKPILRCHVPASH